MSREAEALFPAWAWVLLEPYVDRRLEARRLPSPTPQDVLREVASLWPDLSCTLMVQEPWQNSIRFKRLVRLRGDEMRPFLADPEGFLRERFGGGKFKMNFHDGMNFVSTRNFKIPGPSRWEPLPELPDD
ncbi:MAG: hypothetical protein ACREMB_17125 [Candidatus Rokuibacteriota bacterium]